MNISVDFLCASFLASYILIDLRCDLFSLSLYLTLNAILVEKYTNLQNPTSRPVQLRTRFSCEVKILCATYTCTDPALEMFCLPELIERLRKSHIIPRHIVLTNQTRSNTIRGRHLTAYTGKSDHVANSTYS